MPKNDLMTIPTVIATALACAVLLPAQEPTRPDPSNAAAQYRVAIERVVDVDDAAVDAILAFLDDGKVGDEVRSHVDHNTDALTAFAAATAIRRCRFEHERGEDGLAEVDDAAIRIPRLVELAFMDGVIRLADDDVAAATTRCTELLAAATHVHQIPRSLAWAIADGIDSRACDLANRILDTGPAPTTVAKLRDALTGRLANRPPLGSLLATERIEVGSMFEHFVERTRGAAPSVVTDDVATTWRGELDRLLDRIQEPAERAFETGEDEPFDQREAVCQDLTAELKAMTARLGVPIEALDPKVASADIGKGMPLVITLLLASDVRTLATQHRARTEALRAVLARC